MTANEWLTEAKDAITMWHYTSIAQHEGHTDEADVQAHWHAVEAILRARIQPAASDAGMPTLAQLTALLPGTYYLDPPDGGDVSLLEQLQRMAADAGRWRAFEAGAVPVGYATEWKPGFTAVYFDAVVMPPGTPVYAAPPAQPGKQAGADAQLVPTYVVDALKAWTGSEPSVSALARAVDRWLDPGAEWEHDRPDDVAPAAQGDERAAFEAWSTRANKHHVSGYNPHSDLWEAWQARAALASQASGQAAPQKEQSDAN